MIGIFFASRVPRMTGRLRTTEKPRRVTRGRMKTILKMILKPLAMFMWSSWPTAPVVQPPLAAVHYPVVTKPWPTARCADHPPADAAFIDVQCSMPLNTMPLHGLHAIIYMAMFP